MIVKSKITNKQTKSEAPPPFLLKSQNTEGTTVE